jgi:hypothetical protein
MLRYGRGRARLLLKHPATFSGSPLVPAAFLLALGGTFVLGLATPAFATLFCLTAFAYGTALLVCGTAVAARGRVAELAPLMPAVFASIHVGAGCGVLAELGPGLLRRALVLFSRAARPSARRA